MSRVTLRRGSDADRGLLELANAPDMTRDLGGPETDGGDDVALAAARARYRYYRERGYDLRQHDWSQREG